MESNENNEQPRGPEIFNFTPPGTLRMLAKSNPREAAKRLIADWRKSGKPITSLVPAARKYGVVQECIDELGPSEGAKLTRLAAAHENLDNLSDKELLQATLGRDDFISLLASESGMSAGEIREAIKNACLATD